MAITVLAETVIDFSSGGSASYSSSAFAVPGGTDCLVVDILARGYSGAGICTIDAITHNTQPLTVAHDNAATGFDRLNSSVAYRRNPDIGTFALAIGFDLQVRGCVARVQALSGVKRSGSPIGQLQAQRFVTAATDTIGLGLTPASTGDSMLCAALGIVENTTLATWTGAGFVEQDTGIYTGGDNLTATFRRKLNAPASANTAQARFGASAANIGGLLYELLAEPTGVDVSGDIAVTLAMSGSVSGPSSAKQNDAAYYSGDEAWTDIWLLQPDLAGVDRRIHSVGPDLAPNLVLDQVAAGAYATNCYRLRTRLSTGELVIETLPGSQSTAPVVLAFSYDGAVAAAYVNGAPSLASPETGIGGAVDVGAGGEAIGGHAAPSPAPYTGKIARHMRFGDCLSPAQIALLACSVLNPGSIWGAGEEDDAEDANQSPVALPDVIRPDGRPMVRITPRVVDPNGTRPDLVSVMQPTHGAVSIDGNDLVLNLEPGWVGQDSFTYTVTDSGGKSSTARVAVEQRRPALKVAGDSITVESGKSVIFDPRINDAGAGPLRVVSVSAPASGTAEILPDGRIRYTSSGKSPGDVDSFIHVYPMEIDSPGGKTVVVPSFTANGGNEYTPGANQILDFRGRVGTEHKDSDSATTFSFKDAPATAVVCGGKVYSPNIMYSGTTAGAAWNVIHGNTDFGPSSSGNYASIRVYRNAAGFKLQGFYVKNSMDGMVPQPDGSGARDWIVENCVFKEIRDDCVQDDGQLAGTFRGCFFQGHVFFSWRPGGDSPAPKSGEIVTFEHCLIDMDRMMWQGEDTNGVAGAKRAGKYRGPSQRNNGIITGSTPGMGHQHPFKTHQTGDPGGMKIRVNMKNCLMRITTPPVDAYDDLVFPKIGDGVGPGSSNGSYYENVHVCWAGPPLNGTGYGPWPWAQTKAQLAAMGITLHDDENEQHDFWTRAVAAFDSAHGYDAVSDTYAWNRAA
ncbi:MAG: hypothetical protein K1X57_22160 [Gemmataceae bacterium]|nr:hypothetical protein [Gemmataceae bacterium]